MQLMTFNSLLMFDIVFMFFLFLVGVTCLVYYLPTGRPHRPFVQTAESLLEAEKCRYRHRHLHLLSQKNGHTDRILTDEGSVSEYEDDEDDINDDESDEFEEIPTTKNQSKKHSQQQQQQQQHQIHLQHEQHNCHIHSKQNQNDKLCSDTKEINYIERNEIELVKLRNKGYYPLPRQRQQQQHQQQQYQQQFIQGKENSHKSSNKILYHCCPPCNLSDCENFYISYDDDLSNNSNNSHSNTNISKGNNNNNDIYNNSNIITTYNDTDSIGITIDNDTISSTSRLMYLKEIPSLENFKNKGLNCTSISNGIQFIDSNNMIGNNFKNNTIRRNIDGNSDNFIGIHNNSHLNDRKEKCNIDCTKKSTIHPLLKSLKSRAIINNKKQMMTARKSFKNNEIIIEEAESTYNNKIQSISTLPTSSILLTRNDKTNVPDDDDDTSSPPHNQNDIDNDIDDDFEEYNEEDEEDVDDDENDYNDDDIDDIDDDDDDNDIECCSTTSVDIVLAEGIDDDASNVIIYGNKRKCQHNCRNRENIIKTKTGTGIATVAQESSINNTNNYKNFNKINSRKNDNNSSQQFKSHFTKNINAATVAATLREHFYVIKETEKNQNGTTAFCNNCNLSKNYSSTTSSSTSKCSTMGGIGATEREISTTQLISSPLSSAHQMLQSCNNIPCPLLSSSSSLHHCTTSFNSSPLLLNHASSSSTIPLIPLSSSSSSYNISTSPPGSPILSTQLPYISLSPSSGLRFSSSSSNTLALAHQPYCCHVKAKSNDLKDCVGPIVDV